MAIEDLINSKKTSNKKTINPIEIFDNLDKSPTYGHLRPMQEDFLTSFDERRSERDIIGVLNTGSGKTLIGLLISLSKMYELEMPALYLVPTNQLINQVVEQANYFGINVVTIGSDNRIPLEFKNSEAILVTTIQKIFYGDSIFGLRGQSDRELIEVGSLLIDDAHTSLRNAKDQFKLSIPSTSSFYENIMNIIQLNLEERFPVQLREMINNENSTVAREIPYDILEDNKERIFSLISEFVESEDCDYFSSKNFNLIIDILNKCNYFVSKNEILISPKKIPTKNIHTFNTAKHRCFLSATLRNTVDLLIEFDVDVESIKKPIYTEKQTFGERTIFLPKRYHQNFDRIAFMNFIKILRDGNYIQENIVVLSTSFDRAEDWTDYGATVIDQNNIDESLEKLTNSKGNFFAIANRYDGIDLKYDMCRILIIDNLPKLMQANNVAFSIQNPENSSQKKTYSTILEQGMGRAVRDNTDYSIVFIIGETAENFISLKNNIKYFGELTQAQLLLTNDINQNISTDNELIDGYNELYKDLKAILNQASDWRKYYKDTVNEYLTEVEHESIQEDINFYDDLYSALDFYNNNNYEKTIQILDSEIIKNYLNNDNEIGILNQLIAEIYYKFNKSKSYEYQNLARSTNYQLFAPKNKFDVRINYRTDSQVSNLYKTLSNYTSKFDVKTKIQKIISFLEYGPDNINHEDFEEAVKNLGELLGFISKRYDSTEDEKVHGEGGPDNLWQTKDLTFVIECKNEKDKNNNIFKKEMNQMLGSLRWYDERFESDSQRYGLLFHANNEYGSHTGKSKDVFIITEANLNDLKKALNSFSEKLSYHEIDELSIKILEDLLDVHKLKASQLIEHYTTQ